MTTAPFAIGGFVLRALWIIWVVVWFFVSVKLAPQIGMAVVIFFFAGTTAAASSAAYVWLLAREFMSRRSPAPATEPSAPTSTRPRGPLIAGCVLMVLALVAMLAAMSAQAAPRSSTAVRQFKAQQPCPATGAPRGPCPGYIVDHLVPLCTGGADHPSNMQWQTVADARVKDRAELAQCRRR